jgi:DNA-binding SARP family transcriptional activator
VEFRILGPLEVVGDDGRPIPFPAPKVRALLALLLLDANRPVSTDRIVDQLWEEHPPATATKTVQVYISQLRKTLGPDRIETRGNAYALHVEAGELDVDRFEQLVVDGRPRDALELWRGRALADVEERFATSAAASLEEQRLAAVERRIDDDLDDGKHATLVAELERLVAAHPLRERLRAQLMLALYRSGRQADALAAYRETRRALADELGLEPSEELRELEQAILRQDRSLRHRRLDQEPAPPSRARTWPLAGAVAVLAAVGLAVGSYYATRDGHSGTTPTSADLRTFAVKVESLLEQAHEGRMAVRETVARAVRCEVPAAEAAADIEDVRANRQSLLQQVAALDVPDDPRARRTVMLLQRALAASFAADLGYSRDLRRSRSCPPMLRTSAGERAHRLKAQLVAAFNPLARLFALRTWSADAI